MTKEIRYQWTFAHSPANVWELLTDAQLLSQWLMDNDILPVVGHQFTFTTTPMPQSGFDGIVHCQVLELVPEQRISYSWKGGPGDGTTTLDTVVTWTLEQKEGGTLLTLVHSGFKAPENDFTYMIMSEGWGKHIANRLLALLVKQQS